MYATAVHDFCTEEIAVMKKMMCGSMISPAVAKSDCSRHGYDDVRTTDSTSVENIPFYPWKTNGVNAGSNSPTFSYTNLLNENVVACETGVCREWPDARIDKRKLEVFNAAGVKSSSLQQRRGIYAGGGCSAQMTTNPFAGKKSPAFSFHR